jgi:hypothetical protein
MSGQMSWTGGAHGRLVGRSAVRGRPGRARGAAVLPRGRFQGGHRRPAGHQPVQGRPAARGGQGRGHGPHRDWPARRKPGRGPVGRTVLGLRPPARVRVRLPRRGAGRAAAPPGRGDRPGPDGPHQARRRARHVLVAHAQRARRRAHSDPAVPDRPADRGRPASRRPGPAGPGPRRGPGRRRARARLLRPDDPGRRADGCGHPPPGRHRRGVRPGAVGDHRPGRDRRLGRRALHHLRRHHPGRTRRPGRPWGMRRGGRGVHRRGRQAGGHAAGQPDDRHARRGAGADPVRPVRRLGCRQGPRGLRRDSRRASSWPGHPRESRPSPAQ